MAQIEQVCQALAATRRCRINSLPYPSSNFNCPLYLHFGAVRLFEATKSKGPGTFVERLYWQHLPVHKRAAPGTRTTEHWSAAEYGFCNVKGGAWCYAPPRTRSRQASEPVERARPAPFFAAPGAAPERPLAWSLRLQRSGASTCVEPQAAALHCAKCSSTPHGSHT